jgi:hypothetical protein
MATIEQLYQMKIDEVNKWMRKANALHLENIALWEIVKEIAEMPQDGYFYNDGTDRMECPFCADSWGWDSHVKHTKDHEPDCLITKARALVKPVEPDEK